MTTLRLVHRNSVLWDAKFLLRLEVEGETPVVMRAYKTAGAARRAAATLAAKDPNFLGATVVDTLAA